jgi:hypothetical protein
MDKQQKPDAPNESDTDNLLASPCHETRALTRRQWLLRLGESVVLAGFSGVAGEASVVFDPQAQTEVELRSLPPGLYESSSEHMTHALFRDERFVDPPAGSETEYARPHSGPFKPTFFSADEFPVVRKLVGLILNARDDAAAGVSTKPVSAETVNEIAEWIDLVVSEAPAVRQAAGKLDARHRALAAQYYGEDTVRQIETEDSQATWRAGLVWLKQESEKLSPNGFLDMTEAQQVELLTSLGKSSAEANIQTAGTHLFRLLKNQTIEGYYTSQPGLKELDYKGNAFYAISPGCEPST